MSNLIHVRPRDVPSDQMDEIDESFKKYKGEYVNLNPGF
jgi:hypothetical protein